jgi:hypothetical protein
VILIISLLQAGCIAAPQYTVALLATLPPQARWTIILALTLGAADIAAAQTCQGCHPNESRSQSSTPMAHAASRAADAEILKRRPHLQFKSGRYAYTITREGDRVTYSVTAAGKTLSAPLAWAFGFASMGQTYLYEYRGALYESQVSFYSALNGLDITIGHRNPAQTDLDLAAGRRIDKLEQTRCFACHNTGSGENLVAGIQCERCHTEAPQHARSFADGTRAVVPKKLSALGNEELSDFCGACHRTWQEIAADGPHDVNNVRFQPYRLATSKCYNSSTQDKRINCVACHDPHQATLRTAADYDSKCEDCHHRGAAPPARVCSVAQHGCVGCHMPKVDFPGGHFQFTDHRIRIVRAGSGYPG